MLKTEIKIQKTKKRNLLFCDWRMLVVAELFLHFGSTIQTR